MVQLTDIQKAAITLKGIAKYTPLESSKSFSEMAQAKVYLKLENLQSTGAFKIRGAYNKIFNLNPEEKKQGVICSSAGNHAQGVAYSAEKLKIPSTVYMPFFTPPLKVIATKSYGAKVKLSGNIYDEAYQAALEEAKTTGATFVHPFNDKDVIAGQGTIGLEIYEQLQDLDYAFIPVGGGGLISGIAIALKHLCPKIKIIGVEAKGAPAMKLSLEAGHLVTLTDVTTIADGIAVKTAGDLTFPLIQKYVDQIVTVSDDETAFALYLLLQRAKMLSEPAGAIALAAVINEKIPEIKGKKVLALISGANVNTGLLTQIIERGMLKEGLLARISTIVPDKAGILKEVLATLSELRVNIKDIIHERSTTGVPVGFVNVTIVFQTLGPENVEQVTQELEKKGFPCSILN